MIIPSGSFVSMINEVIFEKALVKLNRKLQPMVDGIHANRKKWEELCPSYQQARQISESSNPCAELEEEEEESSQCTDTTHTQSCEHTATNQITESTHRVESN